MVTPSALTTHCGTLTHPPHPAPALSARSYRDELSAARAYDRMAVLLIGPTAATNFPAEEALADNSPMSAPMISLLRRFKPELLGGKQASSADAAHMADSPQYIMGAHSGGSALPLWHASPHPDDDCQYADASVVAAATQREASKRARVGFNSGVVQGGAAALTGRLGLPSPMDMPADYCSPALDGGAHGASGSGHGGHGGGQPNDPDGLAWMEDWITPGSMDGGEHPQHGHHAPPPAPPQQHAHHFGHAHQQQQQQYGGHQQYHGYGEQQLPMPGGGGGWNASHSGNGNDAVSAQTGPALRRHNSMPGPRGGAGGMAGMHGDGAFMDEAWGALPQTHSGPPVSLGPEALHGSCAYGAGGGHAPRISWGGGHLDAPPPHLPPLAPAGGSGSQYASMRSSASAPSLHGLAQPHQPPPGTSSGGGAGGSDSASAARFIDVLSAVLSTQGQGGGGGQAPASSPPEAAAGSAAAGAPGGRAEASSSLSKEDMAIVASLLAELLSSGQPMVREGDRKLSMNLVNLALPSMGGMPGCNVQMTLQLERER